MIQARIWPGFDTPLREVRSVLSFMLNSTVEAVQVNGDDSEQFRGVMREVLTRPDFGQIPPDQRRGTILTLHLWAPGEQRPHILTHHDTPGRNLYISGIRNDVSQIDSDSVYPFGLRIPDEWPGPAEWQVSDGTEPDWTDRDWVESQFESWRDQLRLREEGIWDEEDDEIDDLEIDRERPERNQWRVATPRPFDRPVMPQPLGDRAREARYIDPLPVDILAEDTPESPTF